jgi:hypothetical protein
MLLVSTLTANPTICTDVCGRATLCGVVVDPIAGAKNAVFTRGNCAFAMF